MVTLPASLADSPASERNKDPILQVLRPLLPSRGTVLEIASGTGQHVVYFAAATPHLAWQPSDPSADSRAAIDARVRASGLGNIQAALDLDVHAGIWPVTAAASMLVCINMIHIAPWSATAALFAGAARTLDTTLPGRVLLYGPFREQGRHTADSNESFDASLRSRNAAWGVRDVDDVAAVAAAHGFRRESLVRMPANNLCLVFVQ
jgi:hypothetical protein